MYLRCLTFEFSDRGAGLELRMRLDAGAPPSAATIR
jgi:hypothetical protein